MEKISSRGALSLGASAAIAIALIAIIGFGVYVASNLNSENTTTNSSQTSTSTPLTIIDSSQDTTNSSLHISPKSVETTNSSFGLELILSVNSTTIPSQDSIEANIRILNTLQAANNLTAVNDWAMQEMLSGPCDIGNATNNLRDPAGIAIFRGNYGLNNLTGARLLPIWAGIECISPGTFNGTSFFALANITSYSFLPAGSNGSMYYAGYYVLPQNTTSRTCSGGICTYFPTPEKFAKGTFGTTASYNVQVFAANGTGAFNSLNSSLPGTYTLVAGDEWGQVVLLHFAVTPSHNLPTVGSFLSSPPQGGCAENGVPTPCISDEFQSAIIFNCAAEAATSTGCVDHLTSGVGNYTITIWYPYIDKPGEPSTANCWYSEEEINDSSYGYCFMINSTAFVYSTP